MFTSSLVGTINLLSNSLVQKDPGFIIKPITVFLGTILNFVFNIVSGITEKNSLGISIIIFTIIVRAIMIPLALKQQKSMVAMQRLQPETEKLKKKYGGSKDPEMQKKMNVEIQKLYSENKINPLGGCLPLLVQMPIFIALNYIMQQAYMFVDKISSVYTSLGNEVLNLINTHGATEYVKIVSPVFKPKLPKDMEIDIGAMDGLLKVLNRLNPAEWANLKELLPADSVNIMQPILEQKTNIEYFFGINLGEVSVSFPDSIWPGILIPVLSAVTTFLSSYFMNKMSTSTDPNMKMQQRMMLIIMPIFMGFITINLSAGVGIYWITSSVFQFCQQIFLNKYYGKDNLKLAGETAAKISDKNTSKIKKKG